MVFQFVTSSVRLEFKNFIIHEGKWNRNRLKAIRTSRARFFDKGNTPVVKNSIEWWRLLRFTCHFWMPSYSLETPPSAKGINSQWANGCIARRNFMSFLFLIWSFSVKENSETMRVIDNYSRRLKMILLNWTYLTLTLFYWHNCLKPCFELCSVFQLLVLLAVFYLNSFDCEETT